MLALASPVYGYHQIAKNFSEFKTEPDDFEYFEDQANPDFLDPTFDM